MATVKKEKKKGFFLQIFGSCCVVVSLNVKLASLFDDSTRETMGRLRPARSGPRRAQFHRLLLFRINFSWASLVILCGATESKANARKKRAAPTRATSATRKPCSSPGPTRSPSSATCSWPSRGFVGRAARAARHAHTWRRHHGLPGLLMWWGGLLLLADFSSSSSSSPPPPPPPPPPPQQQQQNPRHAGLPAMMLLGCGSRGRFQSCAAPRPSRPGEKTACLLATPSTPPLWSLRSCWWPTVPWVVIRDRRTCGRGFTPSPPLPPRLRRLLPGL